LAVSVPQIVYPYARPSSELHSALNPYRRTNTCTVIDLVERKELRFLMTTQAVEYLNNHVKTVYPTTLQRIYSRLLGLPYKFENR